MTKSLWVNRSPIKKHNMAPTNPLWYLNSPCLFLLRKKKSHVWCECVWKEEGEVSERKSLTYWWLLSLYHHFTFPLKAAICYYLNFVLFVWNFFLFLFAKSTSMSKSPGGDSEWLRLEADWAACCNYLLNRYTE